jgi:site-specific DNA recombinase
MSNAVIYTRVSTKEQAEKRLSLENQEKECKEFARKKEQLLVPDANIFRDKGESAKFADRPELQRMLQFVKENKGKVEILYIWKIDRLARNLGDYYGIKVALAKYGVRIISVTEPIDDDPVGRFLEAILAAAAQFDNEIRAIRSLTGMRMRVEQGEWPHSATIGYKKVNKSVVIDPEFSEAITDVLVQFSTGTYTVADISRYAFDKGIMTKSGKQKPHDAMKKILINLFYAGYTKNKLSAKIIKGRHTALVDEEVIHKNTEAVNKNKRVVVISGDDLYSLKGTLLCVNCHKYLGASTPHGNGGHYPKYHCTRATCTKKITGKKSSGDVDVIHREFRELLEARRPLNEGITRLYKSLVLKAWNDEYGKALESAGQVNRDIEIHSELRFATNKKFIADKITEKDRDEQIKRIDEKIEVLEQEKVEMDSYVKEKERIVDDAMSFIKTPDIFWNRASTRSRQAIQRLLFPSGIPYDFETGFGTIKQIDSYLLLDKISGKNAENTVMVAASGLEPLTSGL